jgi:hypothetical protein
MFRVRSHLAVMMTFFLAAWCAAQDTRPALQIAMGTLENVGKDSLTIRPRGPDGKFQKSVTLRVTGTSKATTLSLEKRGGKMVAVQRETDLKDFQPGQSIAVIYTTSGAAPVVLSAVVQSASEK